MSLHLERPFRLRPNRLLPPRAAMDIVKLRRPNNPDLELAKPISQSVPSQNISLQVLIYIR